MKVEKLIERYSPSRMAYEVVLDHSMMVAKKAVDIADALVGKGISVDIELVERGALLHDIGVFFTYAPKIGCFGSFDYMQHGVLGFLILMKEGLRDEACIALRHIGVGLKEEDIMANRLPLLSMNMVPLTIEEKIVCVADLFYSKSSSKEKSVDEIVDLYRSKGKRKDILRLFKEVGIF